jgi:hypothetical protein
MREGILVLSLGEPLEGLLVILVGNFSDSRVAGGVMPVVGADVGDAGYSPIDTGDLDSVCRVGIIIGAFEGWNVPSGESTPDVVLRRINSLSVGTSSKPMMATRDPNKTNIPNDDTQRLRRLKREY